MEKQANFEGWAIVEMFGHQREIGFVTTDVFGTACLFRIDTPELPEREWTLEKPEWISTDDGSSTLAPRGAKVRRPSSPARTKLVGPSAVYAMTPCTEEVALKGIEKLIPRPLILLSMPENSKPLLTPGSVTEIQEDDEDDYMQSEEDEYEDGAIA
jgi:hypothetical protein